MIFTVGAEGATKVGALDLTLKKIYTNVCSKLLLYITKFI